MVLGQMLLFPLPKDWQLTLVMGLSMLLILEMTKLGKYLHKVVSVIACALGSVITDIR